MCSVRIQMKREEKLSQIPGEDTLPLVSTYFFDPLMETVGKSIPSYCDQQLSKPLLCPALCKVYTIVRANYIFSQYIDTGGHPDLRLHE